MIIREKLLAELSAAGWTGNSERLTHGHRGIGFDFPELGDVELWEMNVPNRWQLTTVQVSDPVWRQALAIINANEATE